jgi:hypothetical protein
LGWAICTIALAITFFVTVTDVLDASLDASNYASYTSFAAQGRAFGTEVVPMAGPFGFVMYGFVYNGELYGLRLILEGLTKLAFAALVLWFFHRARPGITRWVWLGASLVILPTTGELTYDLLVLLAAVYLLLARPSLIVVGAVVSLLAFLALCKGTQLFFTAAVLAVLSGEAAWRRSWRVLGVLVGGFLLALCILWTVSRQDLGNLPAYVHNIKELSAGYNSGMALQESPLSQVIGITCMAALLIGLLLLVAPNRRNPAIVASTLVLGGFSFLEWKHGFVRADGHVFLFFHYVIIGGLTALLIDRAANIEQRNVRVRTWVAVAGGLFALFGTGEHVSARLQLLASTAAKNVPNAMRQVFRPFARREQLEADLAKSRVRFALPEVTRHAEKHPIGFFGYQSGYLPLNDLNYQPSPVAGGGPFSVFTPHLQRINERFVLSTDTRPDFYLLKLQTIDERFVTQDDAASLNAILQLYEPVLAERDMLLLRARSHGSPTITPRKLQQVALRPGEKIEVPAASAGEVILAAFNLPASLPGLLRGAVYKSPIVTLELLIDGYPGPLTRRIIPSMASQAFIVSPFIDQTVDLLHLYSQENGSALRGIMLRSDPKNGLSENQCTVTFFVQQRPSPIDPVLGRRLAEQFKYPMANRAPAVIESPNARATEVEGRLVQQLEPPGKLAFALEGNERSLYFDYGFDPESHGRGTTDGADFIVELVSPGSPPQQLFMDRLTPKTITADRGRHHAHLWLPPVINPGGQLILRTTGGPSQAADWDWTYFDSIRIHGGAYQLGQFPGFSVSPQEVHGAAPRIIQHEDRDVLLLNAPGRLVFELHGTERRLRFSAGLIPGSYLEGNSDGVDFIVEINAPKGATATVFRRSLQPKMVTEDRGTQTFDVNLPAHTPGSRLTVRADPGATGDLGWDWSYISDVRVE